MNTDEEKLNALTERIIACAIIVHNVLGLDFRKEFTQCIDDRVMRKAGLRVDREVEIIVYYDGILVGKYFADMVVEGMVLVETKQ